jgi:hypothetical protein
VTPSVASRLVLCLLQAEENALATRIGLAVDHLRSRVRLARRDRRAVSRALADDCPESLLELRAATMADRVEDQPWPARSHLDRPSR